MEPTVHLVLLMAERSQISVRTIWTVALHVLLLLVILSVLREARTVIAWILIALIVALALSPIVAWLERHGVRRSLAVFAVFLVGIIIVGGALASVIPAFIAQARSLIASAPTLIERLRGLAPFDWLDARFDITSRVRDALAQDTGVALSYLMSFAGTVFTGLIAIVTIAVLCAFMLLSGPQVTRAAMHLVEPAQRRRVAGITQRIRRSVGGYVAGVLIIATIGGVVTTVTLLVLGVPYFLALGLMMILLGIIPFVGATLGGLLVVGVSFLTTGTTAGVIAAIVFVLYQQVENQLLQPLVQRRTIHMNPLIIAVAVLIGTALLGILGTVLALPVAGAVQVVVRDVAERREARWGAGPDADGDDRETRLDDA